MKYDPLKHHRRSIRLKGYDYAQPGAYFVTICAHQRAEMFGEVVESEMRLNEYGQIAAARWRWLADQYPYVRLDAWIIMPNHIHGILIMVDDDTVGRGGSRPAPTRPDMPKRKPLDQLIGAFKTVSAKYINQLRQTPGAPVWQRNYYEHIIRNDRALQAIRHYIQNNPLKWQQDGDNLNNQRRIPPPSRADDYLAEIEPPPYNSGVQ
jgi:REP element-mobilizing transposase RayT